MRELQLILLVIAIGIAGRLIPHLPNATSMISLSLFVGYRLSRESALLVTAVVLLISDALLAFIYGYPWFGSWMIFTYSGMLIISLFGKRLSDFNWGKLGYYAGSACLAYWLWTNLGVFLLSGYYPHNLSGFLTCYYLALPFLGNSLLGNLLWAPILFGSWQALSHFIPLSRL